MRSLEHRENKIREDEQGEVESSMLANYCWFLGQWNQACYFQPHLSVPIRQAIHQRRMGSIIEVARRREAHCRLHKFHQKMGEFSRRHLAGDCLMEQEARRLAG